MATEQLDEAKEAVEEGGEKLTGNGNADLKRLLLPAAAGIGTLAATYAARKAPDLMREHVLPKLEDKGADEAQKIGQKAAQGMQSQGGVMGKVAGKAAEKLTGGGRGGKGKTRRLPIQRWTDVAVPVATAYEKWTQFEEFPKFMHRVLSVQEEDDGKIRWEEKIWFSKRQWQGVITDQKKNDRIAWKTEQGTSHEGIVSFHKLDDRLTRVLVTVDFQPSGIMEKMASGLRFVKRAVQADLARFKAYAEFDETEGLEYSQESETKDDSKDKDKKDEESGSNGNTGKRSSSRSNGSNGDSDSSESQEEQEQARQERAERREQRRS